MRPANGLGQDAAHVNNFDLIALAPVVTLRHWIRNRHALDLWLANALQCRPGENSMGHNGVHLLGAGLDQLVRCFCQCTCRVLWRLVSPHFTAIKSYHTYQPYHRAKLHSALAHRQPGPCGRLRWPKIGHISFECINIWHLPASVLYGSTQSHTSTYRIVKWRVWRRPHLARQWHNSPNPSHSAWSTARPGARRTCCRRGSRRIPFKCHI